MNLWSSKLVNLSFGLRPKMGLQIKFGLSLWSQRRNQFDRSQVSDQIKTDRLRIGECSRYWIAKTWHRTVLNKLRARHAANSSDPRGTGRVCFCSRRLYGLGARDTSMSRRPCRCLMTSLWIDVGDCRMPSPLPGNTTP